ncbi:hypothetical protein AWB80_06896 [Caballeronia pedi]|uniref:Uncharacterized protein n=1 Tax=Caballeronia pedi TaxID=1777141 RepID=A0A158DHA0_9BURK|nr:hypothetical protein AWB80_06896 [Caballeronia pedi]
MGKLKQGKDGALQAEIDAFYKTMRAKALLKALAWFGDSPSKLAYAIGMDRDAASVWIKRGGIPPRAALLLERVAGFPLTASEMCPGVEWARFKKRQCPACHHYIYPPRYRTVCLSPTKDGRYVPTFAAPKIGRTVSRLKKATRGAIVSQQV